MNLKLKFHLPNNIKKLNNLGINLWRRWRAPLASGGMTEMEVWTEKKKEERRWSESEVDGGEEQLDGGGRSRGVDEGVRSEDGKWNRDFVGVGGRFRRGGGWSTEVD